MVTKTHSREQDRQDQLPGSGSTSALGEPSRTHQPSLKAGNGAGALSKRSQEDTDCGHALSPPSLPLPRPRQWSPHVHPLPGHCLMWAFLVSLTHMPVFICFSVNTTIFGANSCLKCALQQPI